MKKRQVNDMQLDFEFETSDNKKYEVDNIWNNAAYAKESATEQLPELYYLVLWKDYLKEKNTWEPTLAIQHLWRLVTAYHKHNPEKLTAISALVNTAQPIARPTAPLMARPMAALTKKRSQPAGPTAALTKKRGQSIWSTITTTKQAKKS